MEISDGRLQASSLTHYSLRSDSLFSEESCIGLYVEYEQKKLINKE